MRHAEIQEPGAASYPSEPWHFCPANEFLGLRNHRQQQVGIMSFAGMHCGDATINI